MEKLLSNSEILLMYVLNGQVASAISTRAVCLWAECKEIPAIKVGRQWRFRQRNELRDWLQNVRDGKVRKDTSHKIFQLGASFSGRVAAIAEAAARLAKTRTFPALCQDPGVGEHGNLSHFEILESEAGRPRTPSGKGKHS